MARYVPTQRGKVARARQARGLWLPARSCKPANRPTADGTPLSFLTLSVSCPVSDWTLAARAIRGRQTIRGNSRSLDRVAPEPNGAPRCDRSFLQVSPRRTDRGERVHAQCQPTAI